MAYKSRAQYQQAKNLIDRQKTKAAVRATNALFNSNNKDIHND